MKLYRIDDAAQRLGLSNKIVECLEQEGRIRPKEKIGEVSYYTQSELDRLIQDLHASLQRSSWREMEQRMEDVERRLDMLEKLRREENGGRVI
ncbi:MAG: MerR family transcriptional regulator [Planctomycetota bacterium]